MKYSGLVPIRSTKEAYTPFSGIRKKRVQHKRAQSEVPPSSTSVMGIQCDSKELLESYTDNYCDIMQGAKSLTKKNPSSPFTNPALSKICKNEPKIVEMESFLEDENGGAGLKKIDFGKVGDWSDSYVLKVRNQVNPRIYNRKVVTAKGELKKVCKIVEFSTNIFSDIRKKSNSLSMWQFNSGEKGVFSARDNIRLQKRMNVLNTRYQ